jgi:hypothetical protein
LKRLEGNSVSWQVAYLLGIATAALIFSYLKAKERISRKTPDRNKTPDGQRTSSNSIEYELAMGPFIVALGGGTGLSTLLRGLKSFTRNITAIVTVTDEGGSSGRLKQEWGVLPPGDVRNCIVALAENDNALKRLLDFRFDRGELQGHSLGNLMLLAVTELHGDFRTGVEEMNNLLAIRGRVLPVTTEVVSLVGEEKDGRVVRGEIAIGACRCEASSRSSTRSLGRRHDCSWTRKPLYEHNPESSRSACFAKNS